MTDYKNLFVEHIGCNKQIARVTLNRPEKANAISLELAVELSEALHQLEADHEVRLVILRGNGKGFCGGYDLSGSYTGDSSSHPRVMDYKNYDEQGRMLFTNLRTLVQQITDVQLYFWNMQKVTIAQLHGYALAGGCELAMMADLVVATDDCEIGHPGLRGLGSARNGNIWPLVMGMRKAKELYYTGDTVTGKEAVKLGMINYAWPEDEFEQKTLAFAERIAINSSDHLAVLKLTMNRFYENMGIYSSMRSATEHDVAAQMTEFAYALNEQLTQHGLKEAVQWRDRPYDKKEY